MFKRAAIALVLALLLSGCGTTKAYEGPELPKSEIAVLQASDKHGFALAIAGILPVPSPKHLSTVVEVDGKKSSLFAKKIHVLPGLHSLRALYTGRHIVNFCGYLGCVAEYSTHLSIDFVAVAGHEYRIPVERRDERDWIWVVDITTGKVVAGEKPR